MTNKEKSEDVVDKVSKLRKLGLSPIASILVLILSTPGFYSLIFDKSGEEARIEAIKAQATANTAYEVLKTKSENLEGQVSTLRGDLKDLSTFLQTILLQQATVVHGGNRLYSPAATTPPEVPSIDPVQDSTPLPENLDKLVKTKLMEDLAE